MCVREKGGGGGGWVNRVFCCMKGGWEREERDRREAMGSYLVGNVMERRDNGRVWVWGVVCVWREWCVCGGSGVCVEGVVRGVCGGSGVCVEGVVWCVCGGSGVCVWREWCVCGGCV